MNIPGSDINLRPEFAKLFRHANISISHLITLDDLPPASDLEDKLPPANTRWILVDHNSLQGNLGAIYASRVHGVIDHHEEENAVTKDTKPEPRIVKNSGSCSSLVIYNFKSKWDALASSTLSSGAAHAQSSDSTIDDSVVAQGWVRIHESVLPIRAIDRVASHVCGKICISEVPHPGSLQGGRITDSIYR